MDTTTELIELAAKELNLEFKDGTWRFYDHTAHHSFALPIEAVIEFGQHCKVGDVSIGYTKLFQRSDVVRAPIMKFSTKMEDVREDFGLATVIVECDSQKLVSIVVECPEYLGIENASLLRQDLDLALDYASKVREDAKTQGFELSED